ncbi:MAG TPA: hypothetical protein VNE67_09140 [Acetobacteraceae bacterium]|nr:hypothetical protein [Acetobacteraceae bacterium]
MNAELGLNPKHPKPLHFRRGEPPLEVKDGRQLLAWAVDLHGGRYGESDTYPQWCVVQWLAPSAAHNPRWLWSVPGRVTSVQIFGWIELPWSDLWGKYGADA